MRNILVQNNEIRNLKEEAKDSEEESGVSDGSGTD